MDNYEEKYKEALQKAGDLLEYYRKPEYKEILPYAKHDLESIFPELMTEDEKIRKSLIDLHKSTVAINGIKGERIVAWLEKQGEQVAVEEKIIIPKFRVGDIIRRKDSPDKLMEVRVIRDRHYLCNNIGRSSSTTIQIEDEDTCELVEKEPVEWSKEDENKLCEALHRMEKLDHYWNRPPDEKLIDWLKSIRLRSLWKPNGFQLHDLSYAIEHFRKEGLDNEGLVELFEQLKKL